MNEDVFSAIIGLDEPKAFGGVEPFYSAGRHPSLLVVVAGREGCAPSSNFVRENRSPRVKHGRNGRTPWKLKCKRYGLCTASNQPGNSPLRGGALGDSARQV